MNSMSIKSLGEQKQSDGLIEKNSSESSEEPTPEKGVLILKDFFVTVPLV